VQVLYVFYIFVIKETFNHVLNCGGDECGRGFTCHICIHNLDRQSRTTCEFCKFVYSCEGIVRCKFWHHSFCQMNVAGVYYFVLFFVQIMT